jgi:TPP-dependent pyruvate/acetoin dehydrogenase alpha subunit
MVLIRRFEERCEMLYGGGTLLAMVERSEIA